MATRKQSDAPVQEEKTKVVAKEAPASKPAPQTYTLDQQQVMAALGIKPE